MRIMLIADEPDPMLWDHLDRKRLEGIDLILSCGDLSAHYLSFLTCFTNAPIVYVPGNHDTAYEKQEPEGCICADGDIIEVKGVRILGLGGSMRYKPGTCMYTEKEMQKRIKKLRFKLWRKKGFDILLTHAPMRDFGDLPDLCHRGFECFRPLLEKYRPKLFAYAHVHGSYTYQFQRKAMYGPTLAVNGYVSYVVDIDF